MEAEASAALEQRHMTTRVTSLRPQGLPLFVTVVYGESDVDLAAEHLGVALSDAETESVLTNLDEELPQLATAATREAIAERIASEVTRISQAHAVDVDD
jgi:hypothetical protein